MIEWLIEIDREVFLFINTRLVHPVLDQIFPVLRNRNTWFPLYFLILAAGIIKLKWKVIPWILCFALAVGFADIISSHLFKPLFGRYRPCHELSPVFEDMILRLKRCSGHNSFTSSHAANHSAIAFYIFLAAAKKYRKYLWLFFVWALLICWGQVYVGVHYPLDILGGLLIGLLTAYLSVSLYRIVIKKKYQTYGST